MTRRLTFAVPGDLHTPTGGYRYDRRVIEELRGHGWHVDVLDLGEGFPRADRELVARAHALLEAALLGPVVIDGLALGVLPATAETVARTHALVALVHHPLAYETGISLAEESQYRRAERAALAHARHVVVTSEATANILTMGYGVATARMSVIEPGTDPVDPATGSGSDKVHLLAVGSVVPRKGFDLLVTALAELKEFDWRLTIVGDRTRDPATAAAIGQAIADAGLTGRILFTGALPPDELAAHYRAADLFVLASRYEGYGMAYAEAISYGLPVIGTTTGGATRCVPPDAGMLVPPSNTRALSEVLRGFIADPELRRRAAAAARAGAEKLPTWRMAGEKFSSVLERLS